jgi:hypothetical protein
MADLSHNARSSVCSRVNKANHTGRILVIFHAKTFNRTRQPFPAVVKTGLQITVTLHEDQSIFMYMILYGRQCPL